MAWKRFRWEHWHQLLCTDPSSKPGYADSSALLFQNNPTENHPERQAIPLIPLPPISQSPAARRKTAATASHRLAIDPRNFEGVAFYFLFSHFPFSMTLHVVPRAPHPYCKADVPTSTTSKSEPENPSLPSPPFRHPPCHLNTSFLSLVNSRLMQSRPSNCFEQLSARSLIASRSCTIPLNVALPFTTAIIDLTSPADPFAITKNEINSAVRSPLKPFRNIIRDRQCRPIQLPSKPCTERDLRLLKQIKNTIIKASRLFPRRQILKTFVLGHIDSYRIVFRRKKENPDDRFLQNPAGAQRLSPFSIFSFSIFYGATAPAPALGSPAHKDFCPVGAKQYSRRLRRELAGIIVIELIPFATDVRTAQNGATTIRRIESAISKACGRSGF
jgi:hypothetical protein